MSDPKPPPRTRHDKFNSPAAKIVLVSSDNVEFRVHKANLEANSVVFRDMFETAAPENSEEVPLTEEADVLEAMLLFCYPGSVRALDDSTDMFWKLVKAFDKYSIGRGMDAAAHACELRVAQNPSWGTITRNYLFASNFRRQDLQAAINPVFSINQPRADVARLFLGIASNATGLQDDGTLVRLLRRREEAYTTAREGALGRCLIANVRATPGPTMPVAEVADLLTFWCESRHPSTPEALGAWGDDWRRRANNPAVDRAMDLLPWPDMKEALRNLPTSL